MIVETIKTAITAVFLFFYIFLCLFKLFFKIGEIRLKSIISDIRSISDRVISDWNKASISV